MTTEILLSQVKQGAFTATEEIQRRLQELRNAEKVIEILRSQISQSDWEYYNDIMDWELGQVLWHRLNDLQDKMADDIFDEEDYELIALLRTTFALVSLIDKDLD